MRRGTERAREDPAGRPGNGPGSPKQARGPQAAPVRDRPRRDRGVGDEDLKAEPARWTEGRRGVRGLRLWPEMNHAESEGGEQAWRHRRRVAVPGHRGRPVRGSQTAVEGDTPLVELSGTRSHKPPLVPPLSPCLSSSLALTTGLTRTRSPEGGGVGRGRGRPASATTNPYKGQVGVEVSEVAEASRRATGARVRCATQGPEPRGGGGDWARGRKERYRQGVRGLPIP